MRGLCLYPDTKEKPVHCNWLEVTAETEGFFYLFFKYCMSEKRCNMLCVCECVSMCSCVNWSAGK